MGHSHCPKYLHHSGKEPADGKGKDERYIVTITFPQASGLICIIFPNVL